MYFILAMIQISNYLNKTFKYEFFAFLAVIFQSLAIIFGKSAAIRIDSYNFSNILNSEFYILSLFCLFLQAFVWQIALQRIPLNKAYFFMSGVFISIMLSSFFIFDERITINNVIGAIIIFIGLIRLMRINNV